MTFRIRRRAAHGPTRKPEGGTAALRHPVENRRAQTRDKRFAWRHWWIMTILTLMCVFRAFAVLRGLPIFLCVLYAQLFQP